MRQHQRQSGKSYREAGKKEERPAEHKADDSKEESCRCKEVSKKTLPEMIKLMIRDLTFRKK